MPSHDYVTRIHSVSPGLSATIGMNTSLESMYFLPPIRCVTNCSPLTSSPSSAPTRVVVLQLYTCFLCCRWDGSSSAVSLFGIRFRCDVFVFLTIFWGLVPLSGPCADSRHCIISTISFGQVANNDNSTQAAVLNTFRSSQDPGQKCTVSHASKHNAIPIYWTVQTVAPQPKVHCASYSLSRR